MRSEKSAPMTIVEELFQRYPALECCRKDIMDTFGMMVDTFRAGNKMLIAGNGGSAADSDHISGELTKSFMFKRDIDHTLSEKLSSYGDDGIRIASSLEGGLPVIPLPAFNASNTAFLNDNTPRLLFAQLVNALGKEGDIFLGISTSGNSGDIVDAFMVASSKGMKTIALTGSKGGRSKELADVCIRAPEDETFKIQELHLPIYHALCAMVESELFDPKKD